MELGDLLGQLGGTLEIHETERERRRQKGRFLGLGQSDEDEEGEEGGEYQAASTMILMECRVDSKGPERESR